MAKSGRSVPKGPAMQPRDAGQLQLFEASPREQCLKYDTCCAPLCPLDRQSLRRGVWHVDEEVCSSANFARVAWILKQRRLVRTGDPEDSYTHEMLRTARLPGQTSRRRRRSEKASQIALHQGAVSSAHTPPPAGRQRAKPPAKRRTVRAAATRLSKSKSPKSGIRGGELNERNMRQRRKTPPKR